MDKSRAYQFGDAKGKGLFFMRKVEEHNSRRRQWAGAFSVHRYVYFQDEMTAIDYGT